MEGQLLLEMLAVAKQVDRSLRDFARAKGLSATELLALHVMAVTDHPWDGPSLGRRLGCSRIQGFRVSVALVRLGLAVAEEDWQHPNYRLVRLTDKGREIYDRALDSLDVHALAFFSPEDKRELHRLVSRMRRRQPMRVLVD